MKAGIYARVSTHDQHTLKLQVDAMHKYAADRVRIPLMPITDSTSSRSRIPFDADRVFHSMAIKPERSDAVFSL